MRTQNQISLTRITLYGIMALGVLLSAFGTGNLPSAHAQEAGTDTPILEVTETPAETSSPTITETATPEDTETPEIGAQGANCSSPVVFDDQWANGFRLVCQDNLYVLMVDLTNPAVKVEVKAASSGNHTLDWYADSNTIAVINADYQYSPCASNAPCSNGLTISNGSSPTDYTNLDKLCNDGYVRREIGFSQDQRPVIDWWYKFVSDSQARAWCDSRNQGRWPLPGQGGGLEQYSYNLVGAGPQFTFDGSFKWECGDGTQNHNCPGTDVVINGEHFKPGNWWERYQSAIGYSSDGTTLILAESNNAQHTMQKVHDIMYQRLSAYGKNLKNAFKFDGGSKAGFWYYNHTYDSTPGVTVPNVIRIQRTNSTCYSLSTNVNPGGSGNVSINTPSNCAQGKYTPGTNVQLNASPNGGYNFSNWSGDASGTTSSTTIVMNSNKSVTANFAPSTYTLNITKSGTGSGTVTSNPSGINCGSTCSYAFAYNTVVTLTASPASPSTFGGWSGAGCSGTGTCTVTMSSAQSVTATFNSPVPAMPSNLAVSGATAHSLTLTWQDNSNNESGFKIYRWGYDGTQWAFIYLDSVGANVTSYTQTGLNCGSVFNYYEVSAFNDYGESAHTSWKQGTTAACPLAPNDDFDSPTIISQVPYTDNLETTGATKASDDPALTDCNRAPGDATVWYQFIPPSSGYYYINTIGSDYDTMLAVWTGTRGNLNLIACNDDRPSDLQSELIINVSSGVVYYIEIAEYAGPLATSLSAQSEDKLNAAGDVSALSGGTLNFHISESHQIYLPLIMR